MFLAFFLQNQLPFAINSLEKKGRCYCGYFRNPSFRVVLFFNGIWFIGQLIRIGKTFDKRDKKH